LGPVEIFALRLAIGVPFLGVILLLKRVPIRFAPSDLWPIVLGGAIFTVHFMVQATGITTTTATNSAWIICISPLAVAVLSYFFLGERIGWRGVTGIAIATGGILLLVSRGRVTDLGWLRSTGDWLIVLSAHTWALYTVVTRNVARRGEPLAVTFGILLTAAALTAVLFAVTADTSRISELSPRGLIALLYLSIPGLALGQWFWQEGVARLGATHAGLYLYLEPIATLALAMPLLGEPFGPVVALGGGLVLAGVYLGQSG
jgi:drug/metabolite transporter (DMT)-like permease